MDFTCTKCNEEIRRSVNPCDKCKITLYCSRDCKKADWKSHKKICSKRANSTKVAPLSPPQGLSQPIPFPFSRLSRRKWLHHRPEADVYRLLIDAYRLVVRDTINLDETFDPDAILAGGVTGFLRFLNKAESCQRLLPSWWSSEKRQACLNLGKNNSQGYSLHVSMTRNDLVDRYGSSFFLMEITIFIQQVTGRGPGGLDTTPFLAVFIEEEHTVEHLEQTLAAANDGMAAN